MIPALLVLGAIVGGYLVVSNWKSDIEDWLREDSQKIQAALKEVGIVDYSGKLFASVDGNVMRLVHKLCYKENDKWREKTTVREIDIDEVPAWALKGLFSKEIDVTERYEKELKLKI